MTLVLHGSELNLVGNMHFTFISSHFDYDTMSLASLASLVKFYMVSTSLYESLLVLKDSPHITPPFPTATPDQIQTPGPPGLG